MLAPADIRLTEETVRDLRAQGRQDRAAAPEAVLAAATAALVSDRASSREELWTIRQAARSTGQSARLIRKLIGSGRLPAVIHRGQTFVHPAALWASLEDVATE